MKVWSIDPMLTSTVLEHPVLRVEHHGEAVLPIRSPDERDDQFRDLLRIGRAAAPSMSGSATCDGSDRTREAARRSSVSAAATRADPTGSDGPAFVVGIVSSMWPPLQRRTLAVHPCARGDPARR
jgi:hypothetical protein